jgi:Mrp family chromosome partitioning ATPase
VFDVPNTEGLYEALGADVDRKVKVVRLTPRLSLVTAGRAGADPVHVLTSERLARVLEDAGTAFDWVIIDTPPVGLMTDANLLSAIADGVILVVKANSTPYDLVQRAIDALGREQLLGAVLNRATEQREGDRYYDYYSYGTAPASPAAEGP